jgi:hypothetical protein
MGIRELDWSGAVNWIQLTQNGIDGKFSETPMKTLDSEGKKFY